jgi:hypothetical protein
MFYAPSSPGSSPKCEGVLAGYRVSLCGTAAWPPIPGSCNARASPSDFCRRRVLQSGASSATGWPTQGKGARRSARILQVPAYAREKMFYKLDMRAVSTVHDRGKTLRMSYSSSASFLVVPVAMALIHSIPSPAAGTEKPACIAKQNTPDPIFNPAPGGHDLCPFANPVQGVTLCARKAPAIGGARSQEVSAESTILATPPTSPPQPVTVAESSPGCAAVSRQVGTEPDLAGCRIRICQSATPFPFDGTQHTAMLNFVSAN